MDQFGRYHYAHGQETPAEAIHVIPAMIPDPYQLQQQQQTGSAIPFVSNCSMCGMSFHDLRSYHEHLQFHNAAAAAAALHHPLSHPFAPMSYPSAVTAASASSQDYDNMSISSASTGGQGSNTGLYFSCNDCGRSFTIASNLKRHIQTVHSEFKPYICEFCGKDFNQKCNLKRHQKNNCKIANSEDRANQQRNTALLIQELEDSAFDIADNGSFDPMNAAGAAAAASSSSAGQQVSSMTYDPLQSSSGANPRAVTSIHHQQQQSSGSISSQQSQSHQQPVSQNDVIRLDDTMLPPPLLDEEISASTPGYISSSSEHLFPFKRSSSSAFQLNSRIVSSPNRSRLQVPSALPSQSDDDPEASIKFNTFSGEFFARLDNSAAAAAAAAGYPENPSGEWVPKVKPDRQPANEFSPRSAAALYEAANAFWNIN